MENKEKYLTLLRPNTPENNLLVVQLLQSQMNWTLEEALRWVLKYFTEKISDPLISNTIGFGKIELELSSSITPYLDRLPLHFNVADDYEIRIIIRDSKEEVFTHFDYMGMSFHDNLSDIFNIKIIPVLVKYLS